jgi:hypothetical protein
VTDADPADTQPEPTDEPAAWPVLAPEWRVKLVSPNGVLGHIHCASRDVAEGWGRHFHDHENCTWTVQRRMCTPWEDDGPPQRTVTVVVDTVENPGAGDTHG